MTNALIPYGYGVEAAEETKEGPDYSYRIWEESGQGFENGPQGPSDTQGAPDAQGAPSPSTPDEGGDSGGVRNPFSRAKDWWSKHQEESAQKKAEGEEAQMYRMGSRLEQEKLKAELESKKADVRAFQKRGRPSTEQKYEAGRKWMQRILTLGGPIKQAKEREYLYHPKMGKEAYVPTDMRSLTAPSGARRTHDLRGMRDLSVPQRSDATASVTSMRRLTAPPVTRSMTAFPEVKKSYGGLRELTGPGSMGSMPLQQVVRKIPEGGTRFMEDNSAVGFSPQVLTKFRAMSAPSGMSPLQKLVYSEVQENSDIDTRSHVVSELIRLGIPQEEAEQAVNDLIRRGVIKFDKSYQGEPVLGVRA